MNMCITVLAAAAPKLMLKDTEIDLGTVEKGTVAKTSISIANAGDAPLELQKLQVSCPCTTAELPPPDKRSIAPGASIELPVTYDTTDKYGDVGSTIVLHTNDPDMPVALVDLGLRVESLVVYSPDTGVAWTLAPRGGTISTPLTIMAGNESKTIELVELTMARPGITAEAETSVVNDRSRVKVQFTLDPDVPMGLHTNEALARVRVGDVETTVKVPLRGGVIGDVLITPPAIISPRTAYRQGGRISEITVRSSHPDRPAPDLIGVTVVGPLQAEVQPAASENGERVITVAAAANAPGGPQGGTVYVMTTSADDPIVAVPVYFRMAEAVQAKPDHAKLFIGDPIRKTQRIELAAGSEQALSVNDIQFDASVVSARVVSPGESATGAAIDISVADGAAAGAQATMVVIETDCPGAEAISIPVLIRNGSEPLRTAE